MTDSSIRHATRHTVEEHLAAFNDHDSARLLSGLADDVVWMTGVDVVRGRSALTDVFDTGLWSYSPRLELIHLLVDGAHAAAQCIEHLVIDGASVTFPIAVFFTVHDGMLSEVKVFREGSADLPAADQEL